MNEHDAAIAAAKMKPHQLREAIGALGSPAHKSAAAYVEETQTAANAAVAGDFAAREALDAFAARSVPPRLATMERLQDLRGREHEDAYFRNRDRVDA